MFITGPLDKEAVGKMGAVAAISSQKPPAASQGTPVATLPSSILGAQETSKVIIIPPGPSGQTTATSSSSLAGQQTTTPVVDRSVAAERVMTIPAATVASIQQEGSAKSVVLPSALIPGLKDFNMQSKAPMRFLMVTTAKNQAGQPGEECEDIGSAESSGGTAGWASGIENPRGTAAPWADQAVWTACEGSRRICGWTSPADIGGKTSPGYVRGRRDRR